jgi:phosphoserine phosphatase
VFALTRQAMGGSMSFRHSLTASLDLIQPSLQDIHRYIEAHPPRLTDGIEQLVSILHQRGTTVYLVGILGRFFESGIFLAGVRRLRAFD